MSVHICFSVNENCYNPIETYGEICVGCGCCSKDLKERTESRLALYQRLFDKCVSFHNWVDVPRVRAIQEKNIKIDKKMYKRRIRYYEKRLREWDE